MYTVGNINRKQRRALVDVLYHCDSRTVYQLLPDYVPPAPGLPPPGPPPGDSGGGGDEDDGGSKRAGSGSKASQNENKDDKPDEDEVAALFGDFSGDELQEPAQNPQHPYPPESQPSGSGQGVVAVPVIGGELKSQGGGLYDKMWIKYALEQLAAKLGNKDVVDQNLSFFTLGPQLKGRHEDFIHALERHLFPGQTLEVDKALTFDFTSEVFLVISNDDV